MSYKYPRNEPHWIQAESVVGDDYYVDVTVDGRTFKHCQVGWSNMALDKSKSDVLVEHPAKGWLRVWFYDRDIQARPQSSSVANAELVERARKAADEGLAAIDRARQEMANQPPVESFPDYIRRILREAEEADRKGKN